MGRRAGPGRGQSPQERREVRRRRLLDAALELFAATGFAATSLTVLTEPRSPPQDLLPVAAEVFLAVFERRSVARATS